MFETTADKIIDFLNYWDHQHLSDGKSKPFNVYYMKALDIGAGFTLKWYVKEEDFYKIAEKFDIKLDGRKQFIMEFGEYYIEIELDSIGRVEKVYQETAGIRGICDKYKDLLGNTKN